MAHSVDFVFPNGLHATMPIEDAAGLRSFVREWTHVSHDLRSKLTIAVQEKGGAISLTDDEPEELGRVLAALDARGDLTDAERELWHVVRGYVGGSAAASNDDSEL